jgi:hypothetical protein
MRSSATVAILLLAGTLTGCSAGRSGAAARGGVLAHGGTVLLFPDQSGSCEILVEPANPTDTASGPTVTGKVVVYFINRAGTGPLEPVPSDVKFTDASGRSFPLSAKQGTGATDARFESAPGTFAATRELRGELSASVGTTRVTVPVRSR